METTTQSAGAQPPDARRLLAVLLTPLFMYQADATIVNVANPAIHADLKTSAAVLQLVVGGYLLASAMLLITGARLGQMHGYRRMFLLGLGGFGLASLICGLAPNSLALVIARVAQGASGALLIPQILSGIQLNFEGRAKTRALGLYSIALAGGAVVGQLAGGLLVSANLFGTQWRPVFLVNVPIAAVVLAAAHRVLPADEERRSQRLDVAGVLLLSGGLLLILLPLTLGRQQGWPAWTWLCLGTSVPILAVFFLTELRLADGNGSPLLNLRILSRPAIAWGLLSQALAISTYYALLFTLAIYLQQGLGHSALYSGLILVPWVFAFGVPGRLIPHLPDDVRSTVAPAGCLVLATAYVGISLDLFGGSQPTVVSLVLLGLGGFGLGMTFSAMLDHLTTVATARFAADISGVFTTCLQVAGTVGVAAFGTAYFSLNPAAGPHSARHAFAVILAWFAATALVAALLAHRATNRRVGAQHERQSDAGRSPDREVSLRMR